MTAKIQVRRDTSTNWNAATPPTLDVGEIGYDTTLKQIKVGDGSSNWTALPWLTGSFPVYSSPTSTDLNNATNSLQGVYRFSSGVALTNGPTSPIDIKSTDGGVSMLVVKYGTTVVQSLWTDGDGTVTPKSYSRVYDGDVSTWRAWVPQNIWGISATEGVEIVAKSITLKDTGTGLTVDGNSTLTGNVTVNGTTTLGNASTDIVTVQAGSVSAPIITTSGDLDTGIYFPAANQVAVTAGGSQQLLLDNAATDVLSAVFRKGATFNERVDMNAHRIIDLGDAVQLTDALSWGAMLNRIAIVAGINNGNYTASNGTSWTFSNMRSGSGVPTATPNPPGGTYDGIAISFNGTDFQSTPTVVRNNVSSIIGGGAAYTDMLIVFAIRRSP